MVHATFLLLMVPSASHEHPYRVNPFESTAPVWPAATPTWVA
jgi:hypothetical protein